MNSALRQLSVEQQGRLVAAHFVSGVPFVTTERVQILDSTRDASSFYALSYGIARRRIQPHLLSASKRNKTIMKMGYSDGREGQLVES